MDAHPTLEADAPFAPRRPPKKARPWAVGEAVERGMRRNVEEDISAFESSLLPCLRGQALSVIGHATSLLTVLEGALLLYDLRATNARGVDDAIKNWSGVGHQDPFHGTWVVILQVVAFGDLLFGTVGAFGFWLCNCTLLPPFLEGLRSKDMRVITHSVGSLLAWRILVPLVVAPFLALMIAYHRPHQPPTASFVYGFLYFALCVLVVVGLIYCLRHAVLHGRLLQLGYDLELAEENQKRELLGATPWDDETVVVGGVTVEPLVLSFVVVSGVAFFVWFITLCAWKGVTLGGWSFLFPTPNRPAAHHVESVIYFVGWVASTIGLLSLLTYNRHRADEVHLMERLQERPDDADLISFTVEELDVARRSKRESNNALLTYIVLNLVRIVVFVPITGMALYDRNVCSFHGVFSGGWHCGPEDARVLIGVLFFAAIDFFFLRLVVAVFQQKRHLLQQQSKYLRAAAAKMAAYGAVGVGSSPEDFEAANTYDGQLVSAGRL